MGEVLPEREHVGGIGAVDAMKTIFRMGVLLRPYGLTGRVE
jgi:hypothetical protein